jgi:hypothetical protein
MFGAIAHADGVGQLLTDTLPEDEVARQQQAARKQAAAAPQAAVMSWGLYGCASASGLCASLFATGYVQCVIQDDAGHEALLPGYVDQSGEVGWAAAWNFSCQQFNGDWVGSWQSP